MHKNSDINIEGLSKIEGHANLEIKIRDGQVKNTKLMITENKRFFIEAIKGKQANNIFQVTSRICGTCSTAHTTCCIEAVENALGVKPSPQTLLLRNLNMNGLMVRDHALHLYLFSLPDVFGVDSALKFGKKEHRFLHDAFDVKAAGNHLCTLVGGRAVHPTLPLVGGFAKIPTNAQLKESVKKLKSIREKVIDLIEVFHECDFNFETESTFVGLKNNDYNFIGGDICSSQGHCIPEKDFWDHLNTVIVPYSQSPSFEFEGDYYSVGSISRLNLNKGSLHKKTKKDAAKALKIFPTNNIFRNNLAQAIEILHSIDSSIDIIKSNDFKPEKPKKYKLKQSKGVGVIEAPRGTLYYMLSIDNQGLIKYGNLVIPTAQNQRIMEKDIKNFVPKVLSKPKSFVELEIEKLIRSYDPCMSCATHFLKVKWL